jgi:hypothetical protein
MERASTRRLRVCIRTISRGGYGTQVTFSLPERELGGADIIVLVKRSGNTVLGKLLVSIGGIEWQEKHAQTRQQKKLDRVRQIDEGPPRRCAAILLCVRCNEAFMFTGAPSIKFKIHLGEDDG